MNKYLVKYTCSDGTQGSFEIQADSKLDAAQKAKHKLGPNPSPCIIQEITLI